MKPPKIVVVGSSNTDMVVKTARIPAPGETLVGGDLLMTAGGKGANQAVAAARLGGDVAFVGRVGMDMFGDRALADISAAGVDVSYVIRDPKAPSGVALIFVDDTGQNSIVVAPGANGLLTPADVDAARPAFERADVVVAQFEVPLDAVARVIDLARELGTPIIIDPAPATPIPHGFLDGVDFITPNDHEACALLGRPLDNSFDGPAAARALLAVGVKTAIITLGSKGALVATRDGCFEVDAPEVLAVDSTAAGDCFTGGLAVGLREGMGLDGAVSFACAAAALSVTKMGAQDSMPGRAEVEMKLRNII